MIFYLICHKPTGNFMPAKMFRTTARGWSYWEPTGAAGLGGEPNNPRLFPRKHAASVALSYWLKGRWDNRMKKVNAWDEPPYEEQAGTKVAGVEIPRIPSDMEIVKMRLEPCE